MIKKTDLKIGVAAIIGCLAIACAVAGQNSVDVLGFYCSRAKAVTEARNPMERGVKFVAHTKSYYKRISRGGVVDQLDSALIDYYYSFGQLDSLKRDSASNAGKFEFSIDYPNLFAQDYEFQFFPNDTGGPTLSIGFEAESVQDDSAEGIAIIDRNDYTLKWLYMHYPHKEGFRRYSRSLRFTSQDGLVFPDSVWVVASINHIFSTEDFRIETAVLDIEIDH